MWDEIGRLAAGEGLTVLLTTHYLEEADRLADRIAILDRGRVVAAGTPDALKAELRGDAIAIELRDRAAEPDVRSALSTLCGPRASPAGRSHGPSPRRGGARALPGVLGAFDARGLASPGHRLAPLA